MDEFLYVVKQLQQTIRKQLEILLYVVYSLIAHSQAQLTKPNRRSTLVPAPLNSYILSLLSFN